MQRQEAHPDGWLLLYQGDDVDDDGRREGAGHRRCITRNHVFQFNGTSSEDVSNVTGRLQSVRAKTCSRFAKNCCHPALAPP